MRNIEFVDIDRVFEPYYRVDARAINGSVLGLYVVKLCCDRLGWNVMAELKEEDIFSVKIMI
jgi:signal transduction histidine kinase